MPIVVSCPNCPAKLSAPDSAAGKQVRCPKCGAAAPVPAPAPVEEVVVVDAALAPPKPKPKPAPAQAEAEEDSRPRKQASREEDDEETETPRKKKKKRHDDDDDDDHDRARRKRRPQKGAGGAVLAVAIGGGLVLLIAVGVVIWLVRGKDSPLAKKTPVPPGWKQYSYPQDGFKAYFPSEPMVMTNPVNPMQGGGGFGGFPGGAEVAEMTSVSSYVCGGPFAGNNGEVQIIVAVARFRNGVPRSMRDQMGQMTSMKMGKIETRRVRWLGHDAGEMVMGNTLMRIVYTDDAMITAQINGPKGTRAKPEEEAAFFDNFELTK